LKARGTKKFEISPSAAGKHSAKEATPSVGPTTLGK